MICSFSCFLFKNLKVSRMAWFEIHVTSICINKRETEEILPYYSPSIFLRISQKEKYSSVWWRLSNNLWQNSFYRYWKNINFEWWTHIVRIFECYSFLLITFDLIFFDIWKKMWNSYEKYYAKYLLRLYKRYNILFQYGKFAEEYWNKK